MVTTTAIPINNQSDGAPTPNQINDKKDTTNTTSTLNNSSHSKIPVLNPTARSMKCASWAGNDLPITPDVNDLNDLTPGNEIIAHLHTHFNHTDSHSIANPFETDIPSKLHLLLQI